MQLLVELRPRSSPDTRVQVFGGDDANGIGVNAAPPAEAVRGAAQFTMATTIGGDSPPAAASSSSSPSFMGLTVAFRPLCAPQRALDNSSAVGRRIIIWSFRNGNQNQRWIVEPTRDAPYVVLRSARFQNAVLSLGTDTLLRTAEFKPGAKYQQFEIVVLGEAAPPVPVVAAAAPVATRENAVPVADVEPIGRAGADSLALSQSGSASAHAPTTPHESIVVALPTPQECPICMLETREFHVVPHTQGGGDVSEHRLCVACMLRTFDSNQCPFCRERIVKQEVMEWLRGFFGAVAEISNSPGGASHNAVAALYERWQAFELMYADHPAIILRVILVAAHAESVRRLFTRLAEASPAWLWDFAALVFRFHAALHDDLPTALAAGGVAPFDAVYEAVFAKMKDPADTSSVSSRPFASLGALYSQGIAALLSAQNCGMKTGVLGATVARVGDFAVAACRAVSGNHEEVGRATRDFRRAVHVSYLKSVETKLPQGHADTVTLMFLSP